MLRDVQANPRQLAFVIEQRPLLLREHTIHVIVPLLKS
jgi:hypothetical protein